MHQIFAVMSSSRGAFDLEIEKSLRKHISVEECQSVKKV